AIDLPSFPTRSSSDLSGDRGAAAAMQLAGESYQLLLHYNKNKETLDKLCRKVDQESILAVIQADLYTNAGIKQLLEEIVYPVDAVIFAGGKALFGVFQETAEEDMD